MRAEIISLSSKRMLVLDVLRLEENGETFKTGTLETEGVRGGVPLDFVRSVNLITTGGRGGGASYTHQSFSPSVVPIKSS